MSAALTFRIQLITEFGGHYDKTLSINIASRTLSICQLNSSRPQATINTSEVSKLEISNAELLRLVIYFKSFVVISGVSSKYCDILLTDPQTRDCIVRLLTDLSASVETAVLATSRYPNWIPDKSAPSCMDCKKVFSFFIRRHHCRSCGGVFCAKCSDNEAVLPYFGYFQAVRVCNDCLIKITTRRIGRIVTEPLEKAQVETQDEHTEEHQYGFVPEQRAEFLGKSGYQQDYLEDLMEFENRYKVQFEKQRKNWTEYISLHQKLKKCPELRRLVRRGVPPEMRGHCWQLFSGANELRSQHPVGYYEELVFQAEIMMKNLQMSVPEDENNVLKNLKKELKDYRLIKTAMGVIDKDLRRTFPKHVLFKTDDGIEMLRRVLMAYCMRNPSVGYCQSMNFICAILLLFMSNEEDAFWVLCTVISDIATHNGKCYYSASLDGLRVDQLVFEELFRENLPELYQKLVDLGIILSPLCINWFLCLFVNVVPLETLLRIWDVLMYEGSDVLFYAALTLFKVNEKLVLHATSSDYLLLYLKAFARSALDCDAFMDLCFDSPWTKISSEHIKELRMRFGRTVEKEIAKNRPLRTESFNIAADESQGIIAQKSCLTTQT